MSKSTKKKTSSSDIALKVEHVSKSFRLPTEKASGIKQAFINRMHGKTGYTKQEVLKDISFEINKGDFFGIVGRNGSGKSTLLKLISQIYTPDSGKITVNGSLVPFIELGVGFNPELTGRENVYLNGAMLGFSEEEVDVMYEEIVEFAELHEFMDQKLKNYSSGMQVRLAFSVAIKAQGDILVLDEVLAVGDEAFQRKCSDFFRDIKKDKTKTVILVTHSMDDVRDYCNRAMMIHDGEVVTIGNPSDVSNEYSLKNFIKNDVDKDEAQDTVSPDYEFHIEMVSSSILNPGDMFEAKLTYRINSDTPMNFGISIVDTEHNYNVLNDGLDIEKANRANKDEYTFIYKLKIPKISNRKLAMVATLNEVTNGSRQMVAFIDRDKGANFIVANKESKSKALLTDRGSWHLQ